MKKTLHIDRELLKRARIDCGAASDTETIRLGLEALVRHAAYQRLCTFRGSEADTRPTHRRREKTSKKRIT